MSELVFLIPAALLCLGFSCWQFYREWHFRKSHNELLKRFEAVNKAMLEASKE